MKKKIWLLRQMSGNYTICENKPPLDDGYITYGSEAKAIIKHLCGRQVKQWFGLDKHLKRNTCIQGYFNVSFTPIKKKK